MYLNKMINCLIQNPIRNILIFGILLRFLIFGIFYSNVSIFTDTEGFTDLANYISSLSLEGYHGLRSPGYPLILSILGRKLYLVVFLQFILGLISSVLWFKTFLNFNLSMKISFLGAIFIGSFLNVLFFETAILVESLVLFIITLIVYLFSINIFEKPSIKKYLLLSLLFGFLVLVKPFYAFLPFLFVFINLIKHFTFKKFMFNFLLVAFSLLSYFGWSYVNKLNTGYFAPTSYYGLTNAQTCVYFAEKTPKEWNWISEIYVEYREKSIKENKEVAMAIWYAYEDNAYDKYNLTFNEFSEKLGIFAKIAIKQNPGEYIYQIICRSWFDFWKPALYWEYDQFNFKYVNKVFIGVWYFQSVIIILFEIAFLIIFCINIFNFIKVKIITNQLVLSSIVLATSILQAIVTYGTNDRYSFPFEFIMFLVVFMYLKEKNWFSKRLNNYLQ